MQNEKARWETCPTCNTVAFGLATHRCPDKFAQALEQVLSIKVREAMDKFDEDLEKFWDSSDVKFEMYLLERDNVAKDISTG